MDELTASLQSLTVVEDDHKGCKILDVKEKTLLVCRAWTADRGVGWKMAALGEALRAKGISMEMRDHPLS